MVMILGMNEITLAAVIVVGAATWLEFKSFKRAYKHASYGAISIGGGDATWDTTKLPSAEDETIRRTHGAMMMRFSMLGFSVIMYHVIMPLLPMLKGLPMMPQVIQKTETFFNGAGSSSQNKMSHLMATTLAIYYFLVCYGAVKTVAGRDGWKANADTAPRYVKAFVVNPAFPLMLAMGLVINAGADDKFGGMSFLPNVQGLLTLCYLAEVAVGVLGAIAIVLGAFVPLEKPKNLNVDQQRCRRLQGASMVFMGACSAYVLQFAKISGGGWGSDAIGKLALQACIRLFLVYYLCSVPAQIAGNPPVPALKKFLAGMRGGVIAGLVALHFLLK